MRSIPVRDLRLEYLVGQGSYGDVYKGTWQGLQGLFPQSFLDNRIIYSFWCNHVSPLNRVGGGHNTVAVKKVNLPEGDSRRADIILQDFVRELQVLT